ncbi:MAG TPA: amino acid ABC transporter permease [Aeromicrobium sp.]|nr:amino acid ABC transporter permease [Aeromicrobium sp.]
MQVLIDNAGLLLDAFGMTLKLLVVAGLLSLVWGTVLAAMRVGPVRVLNVAGTFYVTVFRNTPLLVILLLTFFGLPKLGITWGYFWPNIIALTLYTSSFVCEALRSGVNSIPLGQAEASRSLGMTFGQSMREVILPQAFRAVVPPVASVLIALTKNTSLVAIFGLPDLTARMKDLLTDHATELFWIFFGIALAYVLIVEVISAIATLIERRWRVA